LHRHATDGSFMREKERMLQKVQAWKEVQEMPEE
jgi:hypothetical protein